MHGGIMDILNITLPTSGATFQGGSPPVVAKPVVQAPVAEIKQEQQAPQTADKARFAEIEKAAQTIQSNYYIVSDVRFTIFKDITGDYVTRFTSLKDGHVTYYPQKSLFEMMQIRRTQDAAIFHTQA